MLRFVTLSVAGGLLATLAFVGPTAVSADGKDLDIETIMKKLNGKKGTHKVIGKALDASPMDWTALTPQTKTYAELAAALGKNKPEKGDQKSWDMLCKEYAAAAKELDGAAVKKDKDAAKTAFGKLKDSCDNCHENHR